MKELYLVFLNLILSSSLFTAYSQEVDSDIQNKSFDKVVSKLIRFSVPTISVQELHNNAENYVLLDAREEEEFNVSHIEGARYIGFDNWDEKVLNSIDKDQPIVIYCSIGYRSEKIGEKLLEKGFTNVQNLYGSIFEWVNRGYPIVDLEGNSTSDIHGYNRLWGRWIKNRNYHRVYK